jgi:serine/threonine protein kinase
MENETFPSINKRHAKNVCPSCGRSLGGHKSQSDCSQSSPTLSNESTAVTLVAGHLPQDNQIQFTIGPYQIINKIGQGGMGEVFLAYDTTCGRRIALKRIRSDLLEHQHIHRRFLKEARITSQLTHPAIIPIYVIHDEDNLVYYTMPYVEGENLKQILKNARAREKQGGKTEHSEDSISSLIRIFLSVCQAVGYAHSKGVLHRDIKPENIVVGKYGEVMILDWGLAKLINRDKLHEKEKLFVPEDQETSKPHPFHALTNLGKVVGTITYMAPERALGNPATIHTDIYSLGVILYQILTLRYPFHRKNLKEFRQNMHHEVLYEPSVVAPYRDVPKVLAQMAMKCLAKDPQERYQTVDAFLHDLESYIEGRAEWFLTAELSIHRKSDWEFQENVLIAEHMAITRITDVSDWVCLMISKASFDEHIKIETEIKLDDKAQGLGFLLSVPEIGERVHLNDGYTLWLSSDLHHSTKLLHSTVEVFNSPDIVLKRGQWHHLRIEKINRHIYFYLDGHLQFSYLGLLPILGTHIGLLARDGDFELKPLKVYVGGQNIMVNCLAVPDAFLAHKDYATALSEYRRIGYSFPGRAEGREALFRAGITLLEQAKTKKNKKAVSLYDEAFAEFEKLHGTPGAPFEYLGKALIYQSLNDSEEELKCYELALRRYPGHPLLGMLKEQVLFRMHESSRYDRRLTYHFILLVIRHMNDTTKTSPIKKLLYSLEKHWEPLFFIEEDPETTTNEAKRNTSFAIQLAFWLAKPYVLFEVIDQLTHSEFDASIAIGNAFFCLLELGAWQCVEVNLPLAKLDSTRKQLLSIAIQAHRETTISAAKALMLLSPSQFNKSHERIILYLMEKALNEGNSALVQTLSEHYSSKELSPQCHQQMDYYEIWAALYDHNLEHAGQLLQRYPTEHLSHEMSLLHFLYGCWLHATESVEIARSHFSGVLETKHPRSWTLFSHYFEGITDHQEWNLKTFLWEKRQFYRQASLFYRIVDDLAKSNEYQALMLESFIPPHLDAMIQPPSSSEETQ